MVRLTPLALLLSVLALAGCGGSDDDDAAPGTTAPATTEAAEPLRVGLIVDKGQLDDDGFNELAYRGVQRAEKELGINGRVSESASSADYIPNMTSLARQGYDLVIGVGFAQGDAVGKVAQKFPDTRFAIIDVDQAFVPGKPANVQGLLFREEEAGYLVGYLAGLEEKRRQGKDVISAVGGMKEPPVDRFIAGYFRCQEGGAGDRDSPRLLAGLGRPGEVQGAGAEPDRARLERRLPGRRGLRPRRPQRSR
jgi:basic membrane protein A